MLQKHKKCCRSMGLMAQLAHPGEVTKAPLMSVAGCWIMLQLGGWF